MSADFWVKREARQAADQAARDAKALARLREEMGAEFPSDPEAWLLERGWFKSEGRYENRGGPQGTTVKILPSVRQRGVPDSSGRTLPSAPVAQLHLLTVGPCSLADAIRADLKFRRAAEAA